MCLNTDLIIWQELSNVIRSKVSEARNRLGVGVAAGQDALNDRSPVTSLPIPMSSCVVDF